VSHGPQEYRVKIIFELESYSEFSPSGSGLRIFLKGKLRPGGRKRGSIEHDVAAGAETGHSAKSAKSPPRSAKIKFSLSLALPLAKARRGFFGDAPLGLAAC
jgi:hypothetical protein